MPGRPLPPRPPECKDIDLAAMAVSAVLNYFNINHVFHGDYALGWFGNLNSNDILQVFVDGPIRQYQDIVSSSLGFRTHSDRGLYYEGEGSILVAIQFEDIKNLHADIQDLASVRVIQVSSTTHPRRLPALPGLPTRLPIIHPESLLEVKLPAWTSLHEVNYDVTRLSEQRHANDIMLLLRWLRTNCPSMTSYESHDNTSYSLRQFHSTYEVARPYIVGILTPEYLAAMRQPRSHINRRGSSTANMNGASQ